MADEEYTERVLGLVERIPPGRVMSYGAIAEYLGQGGPRQVGAVMSHHGGGVPWHRVVAANGRLVPGHEAEALRRHRAEGTPLRGERVDMRTAAWWPDDDAYASTITLVDLGLSAVPDVIRTNPKLTHLHLDGNQITVLPEWLGDLTGLTALTLSGNPLTGLPDSLGKLTNLTKLHLDQVGLGAVPDWIGALTNLTQLWLDENRLTVLPDSLAGLGKLESLTLNRNRLTALPDWVGSLTNLVELWLDGNQLVELPDGIAALPNLRTLVLDGNPLLRPPAT